MRNYFQNQRILVTGGAGFLGSHLIDSLITRGCDVICLDNLFTGNKANIQHLMNHPQFEFIRHDVCLPIQLEVDQIFNLACPASPEHYQHNPIHTTKTSVFGALNMLELAVHNKARIFQASTSEVYGDPIVHPQPESYWGHVNPVGIRSCYDEGKRCAETLFFDFHRKHDVDIRVARIFNTYGPRMHPNDGRVVSNFVIQALKNEDITLFGLGMQTRSFCYVDDLVEAILRFMDKPLIEIRNGNPVSPINLGNSQEITIRALADLIIELTQSKSRLVFKPMPADDPAQRQPELSQARQLLAWEANTELHSGLKKTIAYFDQILTKSKTMIGNPDQPSSSTFV